MTSERVKPVPRRWWWRKRLGVVLGLFVLLVAGVRIWWGWHADRVLAAEVDRIRAAGQPLTWAELQPDPVPDAENAALLYRQAGKNPLLRDGFSLYDPRPAEQRRLSSMLMYLEDRPFRQEHAADLRAVLKLAAEDLKRCRKARSRGRCDWGIDFRRRASDSKAWDAMPPFGLVRLMKLAALDAHDRGRDDEVVEYLEDMRAYGRALAAGPGVSWCLARFSAEANVVDALETLTPSMQLAPAPGGVPRERITTLVAALLDDGCLGADEVRAMAAERCMGYDACEQARRDIRKTGSPTLRRVPVRGLIRFVTSPMWRLDEARLVRYLTGLVDAAGQPSPRKAWAKMPDDPYSRGRVARITHPLTRILTPSLGRFYMLRFKTQALRRMGATALAIRLYELDRGARPGTLEELVPKYLPAVPIDPFKDKDPIGYIPNGEYPRLYARGEDLRDDKGKFRTPDKGPMERVDVVQMLNGNRPRSEIRWEEPDFKDPPDAPWDSDPYLTPPSPPPTPAPQSPPATAPAPPRPGTSTPAAPTR